MWLYPRFFPARCRRTLCRSDPWPTYLIPWEIVDPRVRIVFVYRFNSKFHSICICRQLVVTSNTGLFFVFPWIQPFGSDEFSSHAKVYSRHVTGSVNCENSSLCFIMKYCPTSIDCRNPASVEIWSYSVHALEPSQRSKKTQYGSGALFWFTRVFMASAEDMRAFLERIGGMERALIEQQAGADQASTALQTLQQQQH